MLGTQPGTAYSTERTPLTPCSSSVILFSSCLQSFPASGSFPMSFSFSISPSNESEKLSLKLNIQKTKIMAFGPITSWQIDGDLEPVLCKERSRRTEKPMRCNQESPWLTATRESLRSAMKTQCYQNKHTKWLSGRDNRMEWGCRMTSWRLPHKTRSNRSLSTSVAVRMEGGR